MQTVTRFQSWKQALASRNFAISRRGKSVLLGRLYLLIVLSLSCFLSPRSSFATVIIPVAEEDLARGAAVIVIGQVKGIESYWSEEAKYVFTHVTVTPLETLKGELGTGDFTIRQMGGTVGHLRSWLEGSPEFLVGEKVLLFLDANADGSARVLHLSQGKFSLITDDKTGNELAYRSNTSEGVFLRESRAVSAQDAWGSEFQEVTALKRKIREALALAPGREERPLMAPLPNLQIPPGSIGERKEGFTVIGFPPVRWFESDSGLPVFLSLNTTGAFPGGEALIDSGLQAWNSASQSTFRFQKGVSTAAGGFFADGVNAISFNDPRSQLSNPVNCSGILAAVSHVTVSDESRSLHQQTFFRILESDLVFANGWENCIAFKSSANIAEVATHELGHVLGLGHSPNPEATMFAFAHFDGRGAVLHPNDANGAAFLYPDSSFPPCTYKLSSKKRTVGGNGILGGVTVLTRDGCGWGAVSTEPWITITESDKSSGKGEIKYEVAANTTGAKRRGSILVAGRTFRIKQQKVKAPSRPRDPPFAR